MKKGDKIRVLQMEDYNGVDTQATKMNGNYYTVNYIDSVGQIHLLESGLAVIPEVDKFIILDDGADSLQHFNREVSAIYDVVIDYIKFNEYINDEDGLYIDEDSQVHLQKIYSIKGEEEFMPIKLLIRRTMVGLSPNVERIEEFVSRYID